MQAIKCDDSFRRTLHRAYAGASGLGAFVKQRVLPTAWLLMGGLLGGVLLGPNLEKSLVVVVCLLILGFLVVSFGWAFCRRARVVASREVPRSGVVGERLEYEVSLRNEGWGLLRDFYVREAGDDPRPRLGDFLNLREPGEEERNWFDRALGYYRWKWLMDRGGAWRAGGRSEQLELASGGEVRVKMSLVPLRRGVLRLDDLRVEMPDPLGLFQRRSPTLNEGNEILVMPRTYRVPDLRFLGASELRLGGETASTQLGEGGEFMGLREYRAGDSLRKISWKGWARSGEPVVKEYEESHFSRYGLILDTSLEESDGELFEEAVSVAASFVSVIERERCLLDVMFVRTRAEVFTAGRGVSRPEQLLRVLAQVEASEESDDDGLLDLVAAHAGEMTALIVVLTGWSEARREFVSRLGRLGLVLKVLCLGEVGSEVADGRVTVLRRGRVQEDLNQLR